jgi:hypothetical protein
VVPKRHKQCTKKAQRKRKKGEGEKSYKNKKKVSKKKKKKENVTDFVTWGLYTQTIKASDDRERRYKWIRKSGGMSTGRHCSVWIPSITAFCRDGSFSHPEIPEQILKA